MTTAVNELNKLVGVLAVIFGDLGDILIDGKIDWSDSLKIRDLVFNAKDLMGLDYKASEEEFINMSEQDKEAVIACFNDKFHTENKVEEEVGKKIFEILIDIYFAAKQAYGILGNIKQLHSFL